MDSRRVVFILILLMLIIAGMIFYAALPRLIPATPVETETPEPVVVPTPVAPEPVADAPLSERVVISAPSPGATVAKVFTITGKAPGPWYFEASFPIIITDAAGNKIATSHGEAQGDWMTTELVPFTAKVDVGAYTGPATINLLRDNPSGLPENDDSVSLNVVVQ